MDELITLDACCVLNLAATGCFEGILRGLPSHFYVGQRARREAQWLRVLDADQRDLVDLEPLLEMSLLEELQLWDPQERALFIELSVTLEDGEAEAAALAIVRGYALATDDRKARRVVAERSAGLRLYSTLEIIREWQICCAVSDASVATALRRVADRATYQPRRTDPLWDWWKALVGDR
jgi:hypothetical protein